MTGVELTVTTCATGTARAGESIVSDGLPIGPVLAIVAIRG